MSATILETLDLFIPVGPPVTATDEDSSVSVSYFCLFLARLDKVQEELFYYPRRRRWRWGRRRC